MLNNKQIKYYNYLKFFVNALKNWDYLTKDNTGFYNNKIRLIHDKDYTFTKEQLMKHIQLIKSYRSF